MIVGVTVLYSCYSHFPVLGRVIFINFIDIVVCNSGGPPRPGMLPTPPMGGPPMMPMMPPPHGMMPAGPGRNHIFVQSVFCDCFCDSLCLMEEAGGGARI